MASLIDGVLAAYAVVVLATLGASFLRPDSPHPAARALRRATEPVFVPLRRRLPGLVRGGVDLAPWAVLVAIAVARRLVQRWGGP